MTRTDFFSEALGTVGEMEGLGVEGSRTVTDIHLGSPAREADMSVAAAQSCDCIVYGGVIYPLLSFQ